MVKSKIADLEIVSEYSDILIKSVRDNEFVKTSRNYDPVDRR